MCSIILRIDEAGVFIGANRDEMLARAWEAPAEFWPGIIAGRDRLGGGTWLGLNRHGVLAAALNRTGTLGPAAGKRSRGELPLLALAHRTSAAAAAALGGLDAGQYRSFNIVVADATGAFLLRGLEAGAPDVVALRPGVTMITSGEPNDVSMPRIARHLPKFEAAAFADWGVLLADGSAPFETALNIPERNGFGTVCSSLIELPKAGLPRWQFCDARFNFGTIPLWGCDMDLRFERVTAPSEALRELITALDEALDANYLPEQRHGLKLDALFAPNIRFFIAWRGRVAVGCGGVALCGDYAEVKRMFVVPAARGSGVAKAVLARLEAEALAAGISALRLETGNKQVAAMRLYARAGFGPCPAFGDYHGMTAQAIATSVFLEKHL